MERYLTEGGAARYAGKYGRGWTRRGTHWRETAILRRMLAGIDPEASLINLACGAGRFADLLATPSRRRVVFADSSQAMLDAAREALAAGGARSVELRLVDVTRSIPAERLDVAVCVRLLHHLDEQAFAAAVDYLAASAKLAIVCTFASTATWKGFWRSRLKRGVREVARSPAAMRAAFAARGWRVAEMRLVSAFFSSQAWVMLTPATA
jgi:SAM-dependent methyltransferase